MVLDERPMNPEDRLNNASLTVLGSHLTWLFFGPLILMLMLLGMAQSSTGWFGSLDAVYFGLVAVMGLARWLDQRSGKAVTTTGEPATWKQFRWYVILLPIVAGALWLVAKICGNYVVGDSGW